MALLLTCLIGIGALEIGRRSVSCRYRSRYVWFGAMLCSLAVSLLPIYHAFGHARDYITSAVPGHLWTDPSGHLWFLGHPLAALPVGICWMLMSVSLLQIIAYDLIRPYAIVHKLSMLELGSIPIYVSHRSGPLTFGVFKPKIVVPRYFLELNNNVQRLILTHEVEHIVAGDWLLRISGFLIIAIIPWNPMLYWQLGRLTRTIELDCDARVLSKLAYGDRLHYADCLLRVLDRSSLSCRARSLLMQRIRIIRTSNGLDELVLAGKAAK